MHDDVVQVAARVSTRKTFQTPKESTSGAQEHSDRNKEQGTNENKRYKRESQQTTYILRAYETCKAKDHRGTIKRIQCGIRH